MPLHAESSSLPTGTALGSIRLLECLARDPEGWLYRAEDQRDGRRFALLEYGPHDLVRRTPTGHLEPQPGREAELAPHRARFIAQAFESTGPQNHPCLTPVERCVLEDGSVQLRLPLNDGSPLAQWMAQSASGSPAALERWVHDVSQALHALHRTRPLHGGVCPERVWIQPGGHAQLWSLAAEPRLTAASPESGPDRSPAALLSPWIAPEQKWTSGALRQGPWTDLYALAAMAMQCLTRQPVPNAIRRVDGRRLPELDAWAEHGHRPAFLKALKHALEMSPDDRPRSVADWMASLGWTPDEAATAPAAATRPMPLRHEVPPARPPGGTRWATGRRAAWIGWSAAAAAALGAVVGTPFRPETPATAPMPNAQATAPAPEGSWEAHTAPPASVVPGPGPTPTVAATRAATTATAAIRSEPGARPKGPSLAHQKALDECIEALMQESDAPDAHRNRGPRSPCG